MLPAVLKKAYAAYALRTGDPDPAFFDPEETWRFPTTVTFLVLSMGGFSFRAQKIYRIQREYFKSDSGLDDKNPLLLRNTQPEHCAKNFYCSVICSYFSHLLELF